MRKWTVIGIACAILAHASAVRAAGMATPQPPDVVKEKLNDGDHWKIKTDRGFVHVWRPRGYDPTTAGTILYVHGYYTDVDAAWTKHRLPDQFDGSGKNALFIVAEAPTSSDEEVVWPEVGDLLRAVVTATKQPMPRGPLSVVGHSAAYRTMVAWLDYPPLRNIILLDAMYGNEEDYLSWLEESRGHAGRKLTIVANDTVRYAEPFVKRLSYAQSAPKLPESLDELPPEQRDARVLYLRSQLGHMEIVTSGKVVPVVLQRLHLKNLKPMVAELPPETASAKP
jgi:hypothetical protein